MPTALQVIGQTQGMTFIACHAASWRVTELGPAAIPPTAWYDFSWWLCMFSATVACCEIRDLHQSLKLISTTSMFLQLYPSAK